jgi:hypothetical protein
MKIIRKGKYSLGIKHFFKKTHDGGYIFILVGSILNPTEGFGITIMNISINLGWNRKAASTKRQSEVMYSKDEVIAIFDKSRETGLTAEYLLLTEQFKKN